MCFRQRQGADFCSRQAVETVREKEDIVETLLRYANEMAEDMGEDGEGQGIDVVAY